MAHKKWNAPAIAYEQSEDVVNDQLPSLQER